MIPYNAQLLAGLPPEHPLQTALNPMTSLNANYGQLNPMAGAPTAPPVQMPAGPPPPPPLAPTPTDPPVSAASASAPPVRPEPAHQGPRIYSTPGTAAHEVSLEGPTQAALHRSAENVQRDTAGILRDQQRMQAYREREAAEGRIEEAAGRMAETEAARQRHLDRSAQLQSEIAQTTKDIATGPEAVKQSSGDRALAGIAMAMGAFGASLVGGPNYAQEIINKKMDDEVAQKRAEWEAKRAKLGGQQTQFGNLVQQYGMSGAEDMWKAAHAERIAAQIQKDAAERGINQSDIAYTQAIGTVDAIAKERQANALKFAQATRGATMAIDPRTGLPMPLEKYSEKMLDHVNKLGVVDAENEGKLALKDAEGAKDRSALFVATGPNGQGVFAPTEKEAVAARGQLTAKENIVPVLRDIRELRKKIGAIDIAELKAGRKTPAVSAFEGAVADTLMQSRDLSASSPGAMDNGLVSQMSKVLGAEDTLSLLADPQAFDYTVETFAKRIEKRAENIGASGWQSAKQRIGRDRQGNVVTQPQGLYETGSPTPGMPATRPIK